jgi:CheY-specific phosphatase CheX
MKADVIGIFNASIQTIFREMGIGEINAEQSAPRDAGQVVITIGIAGDLKGTLILGTDLKSAFSLVHRMLKNMNMSFQSGEFDKLHRGSLCEIANLVAARAVNAFSEMGIECGITPPTIITGEDVIASMFTIRKSYRSGYRGAFGSLDLFLGLEKSTGLD